MGRVAGSRTHIETLLSELEVRYDSFPVNQTTVSLPHEQFERVREQRDPGSIDAYVEVQNEDGEVLHVEQEGTMHLPGDAVDVSAEIEPQVAEAVAETAGVDCTVEDVESATIAGLRDDDEPDRETHYHLVVVFDARYETGTPGTDARWQQESTRPDPAFA